MTASDPSPDASSEAVAGDGPEGGCETTKNRHTRLGMRTALISAATLASRILGLVREMISAALFGDRSGIFDAFLTAWRVPNLFRRFLGEGALSTSFQTALTAVDSDHGDRAGNVLFRETILMLLGLLVGLCLLLMGAVALAPDLMPFTGWEWLGADPGAVRELTLRMLPFVVLVCVSALFTGALHVRGRFGAPAVAPVAMNLVWIVVLLVIAWHFGWFGNSPLAPGELGEAGQARQMAMARWLAAGVLFAGVVQLAAQLPALRAAGFLRSARGGARVRLPDGAPRPLEVLRRSAPLAFGAAVYQINVMVDGLMAESLPDGGPTNHYYANRLQQFPLALVAIAATSAVFPALQALGHRRELRTLRDLHDRTHLAIAAIAIPAACGLFALAQPVVEVVFERGAFGREGVMRCTGALEVLCLAILPAGATGLIARTYYAMGDFVTPVKVSVVMLVLNVGLNAWFLVGLGMDVEGLAAATAITSALNAVCLLPGLTRVLKLPPSKEPVLRHLVKILAVSVLAGLAARLTEGWLDDILGRTVALGLAIGVGGSVYFSVANLIGVDAVRVIADKLKGRLRGR